MTRHVAVFILTCCLSGGANAWPPVETRSLPPGGTSALCPTGGSLGILVERVEQAIAAQLGLRNGRGALVTRVIRSRAGHKAGLERFDVITHLNDKPVTAKSLQSMLKKLKPGRKVKLRVVRRMKPLTLTAVLEKSRPLPKQKSKKKKRSVASARSRSDQRRRAGCKPRPDGLSSQIARVEQRGRECDSKSRSYASQLRSISSQERTYSREMSNLERQLARERAELERRLARLETRLEGKKRSIAKKQKDLVAKRKSAESGKAKVTIERRLLEKQTAEMKSKRKKVEAEKNRKRKRREIL